MNPEIHSIVQEVMKYDKMDREAHLSVQLFRLLALLAEEAEKATNWIMVLTGVIAVLTAFLVLTIFFEFPKITVKPNQQPTLSIEKPTENKNDKYIQTLPKGSHHVPHIITK